MLTFLIVYLQKFLAKIKFGCNKISSVLHMIEAKFPLGAINAKLIKANRFLDNLYKVLKKFRKCLIELIMILVVWGPILMIKLKIEFSWLLTSFAG